MFTTETKIRVRYAETDQMGVVYHSNFFPYFESARTESIRELGFTYADMEKMGVIMPVVDVHCRYIRPARYDDLLTIRTTLKEMPLQHKIEFHHDVYNEKEEHLATAKITLYFVEAGTMKKTVMPKQLQEKLQAYFP
ncbi:MAG TPA: thioesterase family protein [Chitinophagaceae bacterium]|nr:thioesterase family protein [Chitinophagaceae bacterium]HPH30320.1 thioesterase family protein [Chitinophagaceae bacterium]